MSVKPGSVTIANLEAAFAGESMANRKYLYFARQARLLGAVEVAEVFEKTAEQETAHAFGHLELLYPPAELTVAKMLQMAIDGETFEYTEMYPKFRHLAVEEGHHAAKRFAALAKVEERHANHYRDTLARATKA